MTDLLPCVCGSDNAYYDSDDDSNVWLECYTCERMTPEFKHEKLDAKEYAAIWWNGATMFQKQYAVSLIEATQWHIEDANKSGAHPVVCMKSLLNTPPYADDDELIIAEKAIRLCMKINHPDCGWPHGLED